ncbi:MAG: dTDP-glucose 4,6-dehydratase [Desulfatiglandales bacterium]
MERSFKNILVTGGAGFIGSNMIRYLLGEKIDFEGRVINLDLLTYAGNLENLSGVAEKAGKRYFFVKGDIRDKSLVEEVFEEFNVDSVIHFAAESHVDRSIVSPDAFITTNVIGTFNLLEAARKAWEGRDNDVLFHHISTDEVYGSLGPNGYFREDSPYDPHSPYSASKAASDHLVMAYHHTYGLPVTLSNCSNNYGPYQFPEKFIPLMILNMLEGKPLPIYGDGKNIRDWLYVEDHNIAVWLIMKKGILGQKYNIGGENEWENIKLLNKLIYIISCEAKKDPELLKKLIVFVKDRPGHDRRYAIDCGKIKRELGWRQTVGFEEGLRRTVRWYMEHMDWVNRVRSGEYMRWMELNYLKR